jgi:hypothetical protein
MIKLDDKWTIYQDTYSWELKSEEMKDVTNPKTGETKEKLVTDSFWFPTLQMCLKEYIERAARETKSIEELNQKLDEINQKIDEVKKIYVQEGTLIQTN